MMKEVTFSDIIGKEGVFIDGDWVESKDQDPNGEVRLLQLADIGDGYFINKSNRFLTLESAKKLKCTFLKKNDLLVARMPDPLGRACIFPGLEKPCVTVVDVCIIRPDKNLVAVEWLKFLINSFDYRNTINQFITGTTRQRISRGNLAKLKFKLPPLPDQIRIAQILSQAENLIAQRKQSISLLDELLKSTFLEMFGKLKGELVPLSKACEINPKKSEISALNSKIVVSFIPMAAVSSKGQIDLTQEKSIESVWSGFTYFAEGDVVFAKITPCMENGKGAIMKGLKNKLGFGTTEFHVLRPIQKLSTPEWIYHLTMQNSFRKEAENNMTGSAGQKRVPTDFFSKYKVVIPPIKLQTQFANIVEKVETLKTQYQQSLTELQNMYGVLSQKAFKGELKGNVEITNKFQHIRKIG